MKIVIDAGHSPNTPGKRTPDDSMREYHFNSVVARYAREGLLQYQNVEVLFTHEDGRDVPLSERTDKANAWGADLFVSIHANAFGDGWNDANGIETFVYTSRPAGALKLAGNVQGQLIKATGLRDRGIKAGDLHVLRETKMNAILVECGFMSNRQEAELLKQDSFRRKCAAAIVAAIVETFRLKPKQQDMQPASKPAGVSDWAKDAHEWVVAQGISDGERPKDAVTREEIWTMLHRFDKNK